jgi:hypothetical protein
VFSFLSSSQYVPLDADAMQIHQLIMIYPMLCHAYYMSEIKDDAEDAGESMKRGAKKTGNRMEEGAEEAKDKVD